MRYTDPPIRGRKTQVRGYRSTAAGCWARLMNIEGSSKHSRKPIRPSSISQSMWRSIQAASAALSAASAKAATAEGISVSASRRTVSSNEVNQGRKVDSIRFRDEDGCRDRFWGWSKKSRKPAGLCQLPLHRTAFLTK